MKLQMRTFLIIVLTFLAWPYITRPIVRQRIRMSDTRLYNLVFWIHMMCVPVLLQHLLKHEIAYNIVSNLFYLWVLIELTLIMATLPKKLNFLTGQNVFMTLVFTLHIFDFVNFLSQ